MKTSEASPAPLNYGEENQQKNSSVRANQNRVNEIPKRYTLYIPFKINLDDILNSYPPTFKFYKDCFKYILHLISTIPITNKDKDYEYVPINSKLLQRRIRDYRLYLNYLVSQDIILENRQYISGKQSRSFKIHPEFISEIKPSTIDKRTLIKSILKFIKIENTSKQYLNEDVLNYNYLTKWFDNNLCIDFNGARSFLINLKNKEAKEIGIEKAWLRFNSRLITVHKIKRGNYISNVDNTSGRLHSVLTQLKSELRQFIYYKEKNLVSIDIVNSQPLLSTILLNPTYFSLNNVNNIIAIYNKKLLENTPHPLPYYGSKNYILKKDEQKYIDWVSSGLFYEKFGEEICSTKEFNLKKTERRKLAKETAFSTLFSPNSSIGQNKTIKIFKSIFPSVYSKFSLIKKGNHPALACTLQKLESDIILKQIAKKISNKYPNEVLFTIHDSIITTEENVENAYSIMEHILEKAIGLKPKLKIEHW